MAFDVVIPLGTGSKYNNMELRYCLRGIEKHLTGYRNIWIIGERPEWLQNINHIPHTDESSVSDRNIYEKLRAACSHPDISDTYLMMNDDHFLLWHFDITTFPNYYMSTLEKYANRRNDGYGQRCQNTLHYLKENGHAIKHFDIHYPILYNKKAFLDTVGQMPWGEQSFIIKSAYANMNKVSGTEVKEDSKITYLPTNQPVFSTYPHVKHAIQRFLKEQFPTPSRYEKS
jgi:hypothetical protein